ncbi:hypothetical protein ABCR94_11470 [Streptomyces sp. 21So2-11]|uniref:hypothetical protein n=1 Tax=Streptomyces sp. 21So2-11 TaxID=3144408 RepID=UPI003219ADAD
MKKKQTYAVPGLVAALVFGATACTSAEGGGGAAPDKSGGDAVSQSFWGTHSTPAASEADPPTSVTGIAERADLVVLGNFGGVKEGRNYSEDGKPANRTSNLDLRVEKSSKAGVDKAVVEFTRNPGSQLKDIVEDLPKGRYVFYLKSWYEGPDGPVYRCASPAKCVVGVADGALETPRDPGAAEDLSEPAAAARQSSGTDGTLTLETVYSQSAAAVPVKVAP